jgi:hypothetical protein
MYLQIFSFLFWRGARGDLSFPLELHDKDVNSEIPYKVLSMEPSFFHSYQKNRIPWDPWSRPLPTRIGAGPTTSAFSSDDG